MAQFLLIHGASHGAWCWAELQEELAKLGHKARAIDLPSHGTDPAPPEQVTLGDYARAIVQALVPDTILVGHSMGGYPITLAAEVAPKRISALVYLCAYTPWPGKTIAHMGRLGGHHTMQGVTEMAPDRLSFTYRKSAADRFYQDCAPAARDAALARLTPQPVAPLTTAFTPRRALTVTRHYITCLHDQAILPEQQSEMAARFPGENRHEIETGHSPFLAAPVRLAQLLHDIAQNV